uniref:Uncharacterized protein n=1 Tax=Anguilla anguilla TaxID=7936 RepID=A0A0E9PLZ8_ANGAN
MRAEFSTCIFLCLCFYVEIALDSKYLMETGHRLFAAS